MIFTLSAPVLPLQEPIVVSEYRVAKRRYWHPSERRQWRASLHIPVPV